MDMYRVGQICKEYRRAKGIPQKSVALCLHMSYQNIGAFENGRCNNAAILLWYLKNIDGLTVEAFKGVKGL